MRITESQLRQTIRRVILESKVTAFGDATWGIWSIIKNMSHRLGKGQRDEPSITKAMEYIASTAGYVMEGTSTGDGEYDYIDEDSAVETIMDYANANRKKSMKSYCWAFMDGLHQLLSTGGQDAMGNWSEVSRILRQDGMN